MQITPGNAFFDTTSGSAAKRVASSSAPTQPDPAAPADPTQQADRSQPVQSTSDSNAGYNDRPPERVDIRV